MKEDLGQCYVHRDLLKLLLTDRVYIFNLEDVSAFNVHVALHQPASQTKNAGIDLRNAQAHAALCKELHANFSRTFACRKKRYFQRKRCLQKPSANTWKEDFVLSFSSTPYPVKSSVDELVVFRAEWERKVETPTRPVSSVTWISILLEMNTQTFLWSVISWWNRNTLTPMGKVRRAFPADMSGCISPSFGRYCMPRASGSAPTVQSDVITAELCKNLLRLVLLHVLTQILSRWVFFGQN